MVHKWVLAVVLLSIHSVSCGDGESDGQVRRNPRTEPILPPPPQETILPVTCDGEIPVVTVTMRGRSFSPREIEVPANGVIRFQNNDVEPHTVTSTGQNGQLDGAFFDSGTLAPNQAYCLRLGVAKSFPYFCRLHPQTQGLIHVRR